MSNPNRGLRGTGKTELPATVPRSEKLWCTHGQPTNPLSTTQHSITICSSLSVGNLVHWMSHHDAKEGAGSELIPRLAMRHTLAANRQCTKACKESSIASPQHRHLHISHTRCFQSVCIVGSVAEHALQKKHLTLARTCKA